MSDLLLELFSEEIPARMQAQAAADLKKLVTGELIARGLNFEAAESYVTPRRLTLVVEGLSPRSADVSEEKKGPRVGAPDAAIWDFALASGAAIITKDEDFAQRKALAVSSPSVVWIRLPNTRRHDLLAWFETALPMILAAFARGETLIELV